MYGSQGRYNIVPGFLHNYCKPIEYSLSLYLCTLLPICTVATAVTAMCQYSSTFTVCHSNTHCHYYSAHCYQYVRKPQYNYCMPFQSSLSLYQCTLLPICTVAKIVRALCQDFCTITVSQSNPHCHFISAHCYQYVR